MTLSIVVPVYNVADYLKDCLLSLIDQGFDFSEYEIICVNDGSSDDSLSIISDFKKEYPNFRLIDIQNQGVSHARNIGLDNATGDYIYFCDGDDFLRSGILKTLCDLMKENHAPSLSFGFDTVSSQARFLKTENSENIDYFFGINKPFYSGNIWRFIFKRELLVSNSIRFNEQLKYAEDELFIYHVCRFIDFKKHIYVNNIFYNYRIRNNSAIRGDRKTKLSAHRENMYILANEYHTVLCNNHCPQILYKQTKQRLQNAVLYYMIDSMKIGEEPPADIIKCLESDGLYPIGFCLDLLRFRHPKSMLVNYFKLCISNKNIYFLACKFYRFLRKKV